MNRKALYCITGLCFHFISTFGSAIVFTDEYALLVGVNHYEKTELNDLQFAEDDVSDVGSLLDDYGFEKHNVILMIQKTGPIGHILVAKRFKDKYLGYEEAVRLAWNPDSTKLFARLEIDYRGSSPVFLEWDIGSSK